MVVFKTSPFILLTRSPPTSSFTMSPNNSLSLRAPQVNYSCFVLTNATSEKMDRYGTEPHGDLLGGRRREKKKKKKEESFSFQTANVAFINKVPVRRKKMRFIHTVEPQGRLQHLSVELSGQS